MLFCSVYYSRRSFHCIEQFALRCFTSINDYYNLISNVLSRSHAVLKLEMCTNNGPYSDGRFQIIFIVVDVRHASISNSDRFAIVIYFFSIFQFFFFLIITIRREFEARGLFTFRKDGVQR